jgi:hypothetical protein
LKINRSGHRDEAAADTQPDRTPAPVTRPRKQASHHAPASSVPKGQPPGGRGIEAEATAVGMVVARKPQQQPAGVARRRGGGVRVGPARLEGLPAAWAGAAAAAVKVKWPAPGGALSQMLTGRWARGVTAVEAVGAGGTVRWEPRDGNRFRLDDVVGPAGRPERGVFFSVLYVRRPPPSSLLPPPSSRS